MAIFMVSYLYSYLISSDKKERHSDLRITGSNNIRTHPWTPDIGLHQRGVLELGLLDRSHTCRSNMAALLLFRRNIRAHDPKAASKATTQGNR